MEKYFALTYEGTPFVLFGKAALDRTGHHHTLLFFIFIFSQSLG